MRPRTDIFACTDAIFQGKTRNMKLRAPARRLANPWPGEVLHPRPESNLTQSILTGLNFKLLNLTGGVWTFPFRVWYNDRVWVVFALLSAFFAASTSILAKIGVQNINSNLATAIRTVVVLIMSWGIVFITGKHGDIANIEQKNLLFLVLSGTATGLSWLCYYRALQIGDASRVIPIDKLSLVIGMVMAFTLLKEAITTKTILGGILIAAGTFVLIL
jgi:transporter family protein